MHEKSKMYNIDLVLTLVLTSSAFIRLGRASTSPLIDSTSSAFITLDAALTSISSD